MFVLMALITVRQGAEPAYEELLHDTVHAMSSQPCFVQFNISRSTRNDRTYLLHEVWRTRQEYEDVRLGETFVRYVRAREGLVESVVRSDWEQMAMIGAGTPRP